MCGADRATVAVEHRYLQNLLAMEGGKENNAEVSHYETLFTSREAGLVF